MKHHFGWEKHLNIERNACNYVSLLSHVLLKFEYIMRYKTISSFTILVFW